MDVDHVDGLLDPLRRGQIALVEESCTSTTTAGSNHFLNQLRILVAAKLKNVPMLRVGGHTACCESGFYLFIEVLGVLLEERLLFVQELRHEVDPFFFFRAKFRVFRI